MNEAIIPMVIVPVTFLFVLLIILIKKAPKAGAWILGGLILMLPILVYRAAMAGAFSDPEAIPLIVVPTTFLFVLLVVLLAKAPRVGAALIIWLVVMGVLGAVGLLTAVSHRSVAYESSVQYSARQQTEPGAGSALIVDEDSGRLYENPSAGVAAVMPLPTPPGPVIVSPIWSEGVDNELDADVYPSKRAAVRALGSRMDKLIRALPVDSNAPLRVVIFQQEHDRDLIAELENSIQKTLPTAVCTIEAEHRNTQPTEVVVMLQLTNVNMDRAPWARSDEIKAADGKIDVLAFAAGRSARIDAQFVDKPWVGDFATFASTRPDQHFIVARSNGTCTSEGEANQQAVDDARARLTEALGRHAERSLPGLPQPEVTTADVLNGGFVVDRFAQSFEGSAGRIWRQALLIDVSGSKLAQLAAQEAREFHEERMSWARMGFSVIGVIVLIGAVYFFLNMATMGYYEWSLRIAGIVLAIVAVISVLMVVR